MPNVLNNIFAIFLNFVYNRLMFSLSLCILFFTRFVWKHLHFSLPLSGSYFRKTIVAPKKSALKIKTKRNDVLVNFVFATFFFLCLFHYQSTSFPINFLRLGFVGLSFPVCCWLISPIFNFHLFFIFS